MNIDEQELAATYMRCSDDELAALAADADSLTAPARKALAFEIRRRGVTTEQLQKLHAREVHREARFDQKESLRRKRTLRRKMGDAKGWLWAVLALLIYILFQWIWSRLHH